MPAEIPKGGSGHRAKVTRSPATYSVVVTSSPVATMTAWAVRDFVRALDAAGVPDEAAVVSQINYTTKAFNGLRVNHLVTVVEHEDRSPTRTNGE